MACSAPHPPLMLSAEGNVYNEIGWVQLVLYYLGLPIYDRFIPMMKVWPSQNHFNVLTSKLIIYLWQQHYNTSFNNNYMMILQGKHNGVLCMLTSSSTPFWMKTYTGG